MNKIELIKKIIMKKEFSQLPEKDVVLAFEKFNMEKYSDEEKVKLTRNLLRKVFSSFTSRKDFWLIHQKYRIKQRWKVVFEKTSVYKRKAALLWKNLFENF